jgi:hypothetical protein
MHEQSPVADPTLDLWQRDEVSECRRAPAGALQEGRRDRRIRGRRDVAQDRGERLVRHRHEREQAADFSEVGEVVCDGHPRRVVVVPIHSSQQARGGVVAQLLQRGPQRYGMPLRVVEDACCRGRLAAKTIEQRGEASAGTRVKHDEPLLTLPPQKPGQPALKARGARHICERVVCHISVRHRELQEGWPTLTALS